MATKKKATVKKPLRRKTSQERLATFDGSQPHWNPKFEVAIQEYMANHFSKKKAYMVAYNKTEDDMELMKNPTAAVRSVFSDEAVKRRIRWIFEQRRIQFENGGTKQELIELLKRRARSTPKDYFVYDVDDDGRPFGTPIPSEFVDGVGMDSIKFSQTQYGDKIEVKVGNTEAAIELIARLEGHIVDKSQVNASFEVNQNEAANDAYRRRLEKIAKKKGK